MGKKPPVKFYDVFVHFLQTYEVAKFWMMKLYLDVSDIIHVKKHTKYANCGLPANFWIFLFVILFYTEKDHFKQKLLPLFQVLFKST